VKLPKPSFSVIKTIQACTHENSFQSQNQTKIVEAKAIFGQKPTTPKRDFLYIFRSLTNPNPAKEG